LEKRTPELLILYRSYQEKLSKAAKETADEKELPEISEDELKEMLTGIREFAEAFDMDTVDSVMGQLEGYRIPEEKRDMTDALKKAVRDVDRDVILSLLKDI